MEVTVLCEGNQVLECIINNQSARELRYLIVIFLSDTQQYLTQCVRNVDVHAHTPTIRVTTIAQYSSSLYR